MGANVDRVGSTPKRVLMVVANPAVSTTTGWPVGFWASELTHPWYEFREAGYEVTIASPEGGRVEVDKLSDPRDESGYSAEDVISMTARGRHSRASSPIPTPCCSPSRLPRYQRRSPRSASSTARCSSTAPTPWAGR